jgi:hypothetical protein
MEPGVLEEIKGLEAAGDFGNPRYMGLLFQNFYMKHICRYLFCPNGSHMCMYDDQETYISGLIKFLKAVD